MVVYMSLACMHAFITEKCYIWCAAHRRYGLVGPNGSGKSTLLKALGNREVPIPEHIDIYFLDREIPASDMTALEVLPGFPAPPCTQTVCCQACPIQGCDAHHLVDTVLCGVSGASISILSTAILTQDGCGMQPGGHGSG